MRYCSCKTDIMVCSMNFRFIGLAVVACLVVSDARPIHQNLRARLECGVHNRSVSSKQRVKAVALAGLGRLDQEWR